MSEQNANPPLVIAASRTPEWYDARSFFIGASEAYKALTNPLEVYLAKTGAIPPMKDSLVLKRGRALEPILIDEFEQVSGIEVIARGMPMYRHPTVKWMAATPDADLANGELLEGKTVIRYSPKCRALGEEGTDELPEDWIAQVTQQMAVMGRDATHVGVLLEDKLCRYYVPRNEQLVAILIVAVEELGQRIEDRDPPEPVWDDPNTPDLVRRMYSKVTGDVIQLSPAGVAHWMERERLMGMVKELTELAEIEKARVIQELGEAGGGLLGDGRMVQRKTVSKVGYTVLPTEYVDVRATKVKGG